MSRFDELMREGLSAEFNLDDIDLCLTGATQDTRSRALVRLVSGAWSKGWDDASEEREQHLSRLNVTVLSGPAKKGGLLQ